MLAENRYSTFSTMNYTFMPSLERRALVRIAITLWNQEDARDLASKFHFSSLTITDCEREREWRKVGDEVIKKVLELPLPELLKKTLPRFVAAVGWQILLWKHYHENLLSTFSLRENLSKLCWTPQGTVDMKKTAEILVGNESLDITSRYELACTYCLDDYIYTLWEQLKGSELNWKDLSIIRTSEPGLVLFWSHYIEGEIEPLESLILFASDNITPYGGAFQFSALRGNKAATRYFLQKLTPEEKERILVKTAEYVARNQTCARQHADFPTECYTDVLFLLLSAMDKEQQIEIFKSFPHKVLVCFLNWPWQSFFMEMAKHMWTFLPERKFGSLLCIIAKKVMAGYKDYNYRELLGEFWQQSPTIHKSYVIDDVWTGRSLLLYLFRIGDEENIKLILKDATFIQKNELILCHTGQYICRDLIYSDRWDLLQFFIQECISSKNEMIRFKEVVFRERIISRFSEEQLAETIDKLDKFCQLVEDFTENNDKRKLTEDDDHTAKKFCSIECEKSMEKQVDKC